MRGAGWNRPILGKCVAQVVKLGGKFTTCGKESREKVGGRVLCCRHAKLAMEREEAQRERA